MIFCFSLLFHKFCILKMRKMFLGLATIAITTQYELATTIDCGPGKVANYQNICIEPSYIEGCTVYQSENICYKCGQGYKSKQGRCDYTSYYNEQNIKIPGCLQYDSNKKCSNCANGFRKIDGTCQLGIQNCLNYDENNKCVQCRAEFSLIFSLCRHNQILGCKIQTPQHGCKQCYPPFKLSGQQCDIDQCQILNDFGCTACECGYFLTENRSCQKMTNGCLRYIRAQCTNCLSHYKLKGGSCQIEGCKQYQGQNCKTCDKKYIIDSDGGCKFLNCQDWLDDMCLICQSGYRLEDGICIGKNDKAVVCQ